MEKVTIFFHSNCFDGAMSAALFKHFYQHILKKKAEYTFVPLRHEVGFSYDDRMFTGDVNVVLDFRYPPTNKVTWWFDHHRTTFIKTDDRKHLEARGDEGIFLWDPDAPSGTGLMMRFLEDRFDFEEEPWQASLIKWADIIDSASFETPDVAVELLEPAMAFTFLLEHNKDEHLQVRFIEEVSRGLTMDELSTEPFWSKKLNALRQSCWDMVEDIKDLREVKSRVSYVELTEQAMTGFNKFIPYYLAPLINYSVGLIGLEKGLKISVGQNPWSKSPPKNPVDLGKLCKKYGGGGHFSVGAIPFELQDKQKAQQIVQSIVELLRQGNKTESSAKKKDLIDKTPNFDLLK